MPAITEEWFGGEQGSDIRAKELKGRQVSENRTLNWKALARARRFGLNSSGS
jgi:hypothetical protein